jgi:large conductance mechanosensitive channel
VAPAQSEQNVLSRELRDHVFGSVRRTVEARDRGHDPFLSAHATAQLSFDQVRYAPAVDAGDPGGLTLKLVQEFKSFAFRGNLLDLAVAVILGLAFNAVVQALVDGVLLQIVAAIFGTPDFNDLSFDLNGTPIRYGAFLTALAAFLLTALALFFVVRATNRLLHPRGAPSSPPKTRECPYCFTPIALEATRCSACTSTVDPVTG